MRVFVPIPAVSEMNRKEHWAKAKRRHDAQKEHTRLSLMSTALWVRKEIRALDRWSVSITVHPHKNSPRRMDDDNLRSSVKWYRDEVARFLGVDDGDVNRLRFTVAEAPRGDIAGVEIRIEPWTDSESSGRSCA